MLIDLLSSELGKLFIAIIAGLLSATVFVWTKEYFGEKGKNFATRQDINTLQELLKTNTEITRSIDQKFSRDDYGWRSELAFRERQLSEFYGPVYAIVKSEKEIFDLWSERKMDEVNFQVKQFFHQHNVMVRDLIVNKADLIDGATMPDCFVRFFTDTIIFDLYAVPTNEGAVPNHLKEDQRVRYPFDFDEHIITTTERLKSRIAALHKKYAEPLS